MEVEERISELTGMVNDDIKKKKEITIKLKEIEKSETMNQYGIMDESVCTINVIEARDLAGGSMGTPNPYVLISIEGQKNQTE